MAGDVIKLAMSKETTAGLVTARKRAVVYFVDKFWDTNKLKVIYILHRITRFLTFAFLKLALLALWLLEQQHFICTHVWKLMPLRFHKMKEICLFRTVGSFFFLVNSGQWDQK